MSRRRVGPGPMLGAVLFAAPLAAPFGIARADPPVGYVLTPGAAAPIQAMMQALAPALRYQSIGIDRDHVVARLCPDLKAPAGCFDLRLDPPDPACGTRSGAFCVSIPPEVPPAFAQAIDAALRAGPTEGIWTGVGAQPVVAARKTDALRFALLAGLLALFLFASLRPGARLSQSLANGDIPRAAFWMGAVAAIGLAAAVHLPGAYGTEVAEGGDVERILRAASDSPWNLLAHPTDKRHPGLWFALVRFPFEWSSYSITTLSAFDRLCAVVAVPLAGAIVLPFAGNLAALLAMVNVAVLPILDQQARHYSDVTLFVVVSLAAIAFLAPARQPDGRAARVGLALSLGAAFHASYAAPLLAAAILLDVLPRPDVRRTLWRPLAAAFLIASPRLVHLVLIAGSEFTARDAARERTGHWANMPFGQYLASVAGDVLSPQWPQILPLVVLALVLGRSLIRGRAILVLVVATQAMFLLAQPYLRLRTYYAMLFPIGIPLLVASLAGRRTPDESTASASRRRLTAAGTLAASAMAFLPAISLGLRPPPDPMAEHVIAERAVREGALTLVANADLHLVAWYFLPDPVKAGLRMMEIPPAAADGTACYRDAPSGRQICHAPGGISGSTAVRMGALAEGPGALLLLDQRLPAPWLEEFARTRCASVASVEALSLWRCGGSGVR